MNLYEPLNRRERERADSVSRVLVAMLIVGIVALLVVELVRACGVVS